MTYDEKIEKAETIISQLEQAEAISMDVYKRLAAEATSLLKQCKDELTPRALQTQARGCVASVRV